MTPVWVVISIEIKLVALPIWRDPKMVGGGSEGSLLNGDVGLRIEMKKNQSGMDIMYTLNRHTNEKMLLPM